MHILHFKISQSNTKIQVNVRCVIYHFTEPRKILNFQISREAWKHKLALNYLPPITFSNIILLIYKTRCCAFTTCWVESLMVELQRRKKIKVLYQQRNPTLILVSFKIFLYMQYVQMSRAEFQCQRKLTYLILKRTGVQTK